MRRHRSPLLRHCGLTFLVVLAGLVARPVLAQDEAPALEAVTPEPPPIDDPSAADSDATAIEELSLEDLLSEAVVTGSGGRAESRATTAANVYQITREQIRVHGWRSLTEILSNVPGLYVVDDLVDPSVSVRGVTGGLAAGTRITKVMINGVPVSFRPTLHATLGPEFIPVAAIERVEIAKGPLSALYGANAFLATINVITRPAGPAGSSGEVGSYGLLQRDGRPGVGGGLMVRSSGDGFDLMVAVGGEHVDRSGLRVKRTFEQQNSNLPRFAGLFDDVSRNDIGKPSSIFAMAGKQLGETGKLVLQGGLQNHDYKGEFQPGSVLTRQSRYSLSNFWSSLRYEGSLTSRLKIWASAGYSRGRPTSSEELFVTGVTNYSYDRRASYNAYDASLGAHFSLLDDFVLTTGVDGTLESHVLPHYRQELHIIEGNFPPGTKRELVGVDTDVTRNISNIGPYLAVNGAPFSGLPALRIAANARVDFPSLFSAQYSWRAAAAYAFTNNFVAKIIAGRAYQAPSMDLLFGNSGFGTAYNVIGARTLGLRLVPQVVQSVEAVVTTRLLDIITADLSVFGQRVDDRIAFNPQQQHFVAANGEPLENGGVELNVRATWPWFSPYASATAMMWKRTDSDGNKELTFDAPPLYPNYFVLLGGTFTPSMVPLALNAHARIVGKRGASEGNVLLNNSEQYYLDPYAMVDASLSTRDLHFIGARETIFLVSVRNIADARPSEPGYGGIDIPTNGRQVFVQLRQEL